MISDFEIAVLASKHKLGIVSEHIFNVWNLPIEPIHTDSIVAFAKEMYELGWKEGYSECSQDYSVGENEK